MQKIHYGGFMSSWPAAGSFVKEQMKRWTIGQLIHAYMSTLA